VTALALLGNIVSSIGAIFQPILRLFASILAFIYAIIPNYAIAITVLTILIMGAMTPLTVKSTKSMIAMQRVQPEIKKLQQKYKGAENRAQLNEELMRLYKEEKVNPAGGCLPMLIQFPFLFILYSIIHGLVNEVNPAIGIPARVQEACNLAFTTTHVAPRYIPDTSKMYCDLLQHQGQMKAFGMDLALKPFSHHSSWVAAIPFFVMVAIAVGLQYVQMSRMNKRNPASQQNSQMAMIQKFMPIVFAYIYFIIPAALLVYMIVSSAIRIITQEAIFASGAVTPLGAPSTATRSGAGKSAAIPAKSSEKKGAQPPSAQEVEVKQPTANPSTRSKNKKKRKER
jgi:YidC/Oxa1 family membrane protein insertase